MHERDWPSIPEMSRTEIDAVCPHLRVVHSSEAKAIGMVAILRPKRAFRPRSGQKLARVSAQYEARPAPLFSPFFSGKAEKNGPSETRLQCNCKRGNPVNPDKRADVGIGPYRLPCKIVRGAAIAVHLQKRHRRR